MGLLGRVRSTRGAGATETAPSDDGVEESEDEAEGIRPQKQQLAYPIYELFHWKDSKGNSMICVIILLFTGINNTMEVTVDPSGTRLYLDFKLPQLYRNSKLIKTLSEGRVASDDDLMSRTIACICAFDERQKQNRLSRRYYIDLPDKVHSKAVNHLPMGMDNGVNTGTRIVVYDFLVDDGRTAASETSDFVIYSGWDRRS